ncbi:MAG: hypothetical protein Kow0090_07900 [Myxococcota bacterium]
MKKFLFFIAVLALMGWGCAKKAQKVPKIMAPPEEVGGIAAAGESGCVEEGGIFYVFKEELSDERRACCNGLEPIEKMALVVTGKGRDAVKTCQKPAEEAYVCVRHCGDGECTKGENICNCRGDCEDEGLSSPPQESESSEGDIE